MSNLTELKTSKFSGLGNKILLVDLIRQSSHVDSDLVKKISNEAFMPFSVGGGISKIEHAQKCFDNGADKVVINTSALDNPSILSDLSEIFGRQSIVVSVDVKKNFFGSYKIYKSS